MILTEYLCGYRMGFAYLCGLKDGGTDVPTDTWIKFPDAFAQHCKAQSESPIPRLLDVATAYKQWQLMQTTADDPHWIKSPAHPPCVTNE